MARRISSSIFPVFLVLILSLTACNLQVSQPTAPAASGSGPAGVTQAVPTTETVALPTSTPTLEPVVHTLLPGDPPGGYDSQIHDSETAAVAAQHRAMGGENFNSNLFERPFDQSMNTYYADLDIHNAALGHDATWVFVTLTMSGQRQGGGLLGVYGAEFDLNRDGRGDVLLAADKPGAAWSSDGVRVYRDNNHDVGGGHPILADAPPQTGDGYETLVDDQGRGADPDLAFARLSPKDPNSVQLAIKRAGIDDTSKYLWGGWAFDQAMFHPDWFDYDDHFSQAEAGSPLPELTQFYPLKALYAVDDTCRWGVGFTPTGSEPGVCPVPPTATPILPGHISGLVFYDWDGSSAYNNPPDYPLPSATVRVRKGSCGSPGGVVGTTTTNSAGNYSITVDAGTYCVDVSPDPAVSFNEKSSPISVTVAAGGSATANFWYRTYLY